MGKQEPLKIRKKSDDGYRVISVRIREDLLHRLDQIAEETNRSRNESISRILEHGLDNLEIE